MTHVFTNRFHSSDNESNPPLGVLEMRVMEILWANGHSSVHDVCKRIDSPRAYTTVMTTLERLFKKGLLTRQKLSRAFVYAPAISRLDWQRQRAGAIVASLLSGPESSREFVVSTLLEAVGGQDKELLDDLEKKIQRRRKELSSRGKP